MFLSRLCALALLAFVITGHAFADTLVKVAEGDRVLAEIMLADRPEVRYIDGQLTVIAGDNTISYPADRTYTFTIAESTGISDAINTRIQLTTDGANLSVVGLQAGDPVRVYDINGALLYAAAASDDGDAMLDLTPYAGIIIISLPDQSFKLAR